MYMRLGRKVTSTAGIACAVRIYIIYMEVRREGTATTTTVMDRRRFGVVAPGGAEGGENLLCGGSGINR